MNTNVCFVIFYFVCSCCFYVKKVFKVAMFVHYGKRVAILSIYYTNVYTSRVRFTPLGFLWSTMKCLLQLRVLYAYDTHVNKVLIANEGHPSEQYVNIALFNYIPREKEELANNSP